MLFKILPLMLAKLNKHYKLPLYMTVCYAVSGVNWRYRCIVTLNSGWRSLKVLLRNIDNVSFRHFVVLSVSNNVSNITNIQVLSDSIVLVEEKFSS